MERRSFLSVSGLAVAGRSCRSGWRTRSRGTTTAAPRRRAPHPRQGHLQAGRPDEADRRRAPVHARKIRRPRQLRDPLEARPQRPATARLPRLRPPCARVVPGPGAGGPQVDKAESVDHIALRRRRPRGQPPGRRPLGRTQARPGAPRPVDPRPQQQPGRGRRDRPAPHVLSSGATPRARTRTIKADFAAGRLPWVSFKPHRRLSRLAGRGRGQYDADVRARAQTVRRLRQPRHLDVPPRAAQRGRRPAAVGRGVRPPVRRDGCRDRPRRT